MGFFMLLIKLKQMYERCQIWRRLNRLDRLKENTVRKKLRLPQIYTCWDRFIDTLYLPLTLVYGCIYGFIIRMYSSIGPRKTHKKQRAGQLRRVFMSSTDENKLFRRVIYFGLGFLMTCSWFLFLYYQTFMTNYRLIVITISLIIVLTLILPFNDSTLCLALIALPSLFSSKVRYVLLALIMFSLYFNVLPNIFTNGEEGIQSFGCSVIQSGKGGKQIAKFLATDIEEQILMIKNRIKQIVNKLEDYLKQFKIKMNLPNIKRLCNQPSDEDIYKCEDMLTIGSIDENRIYIPGVCPALMHGFAVLCQGTKSMVVGLYNDIKEEVLEKIREIQRELYFNVRLNHQFEYSYNASESFLEPFKRIGGQFMDRHWLLGYMGVFLVNIRIIVITIFSFWIFINAVIYRYRYLRSDAFDNVYLSEELMEIERKRAESRKETIYPLTTNERKIFISTFDPTMTTIEINRLILGVVLFFSSLGQVMLFFGVDLLVFVAVKWYNDFIDILCDIFTPASIKVEFKGDSFLGNQLSRLNALDIKQKIIDKFQSCKSSPVEPGGVIYQKILFYLFIVVLTLFTSAYGLRFRHYIASIFYPHRVPIRAVWLYNNILCQRGNIYQFWRRQMRTRVYGEQSVERVSILDRLCAKFTIIRIICIVIGVYGKHKYCQNCGQKVMIDGSDQSVSCANKCGAIYCFECLGDQNNSCAVCMQPIDYAEIGHMSEELDSSDEEVAYDLNDEDFLYQYSTERKSETKLSQEWNDSDLSAYQRKDLISLAYRYDTVDSLPTTVYLVDNEDYDAEDESDVNEDYQRYLFSLERELGIPVPQILEMKRNAEEMVAEGMDRRAVNKVKEDKHSYQRKEEDQRILKNAITMVNKDKQKCRKRP